MTGLLVPRATVKVLPELFRNSLELPRAVEIDRMDLTWFAGIDLLPVGHDAGASHIGGVFSQHLDLSVDVEFDETSNDFTAVEVCDVDLLDPQTCRVAPTTEVIEIT